MYIEPYFCLLLDVSDSSTTSRDASVRRPVEELHDASEQRLLEELHHQPPDHGVAAAGAAGSVPGSSGM